MEQAQNLTTRSDTGDSLESFLDDVDGKLKSFGQVVEAAAGEIQIQTHLGLLEAGEFWRNRKSELLAIASRFKEAQAKPKAALEECRLELFFGKEDAKEGLLELRQRLDATEKNIIDLGIAANADAKAALERLRDAYDAIKKKLLH